MLIFLVFLACHQLVPHLVPNSPLVPLRNVSWGLGVCSVFVRSVSPRRLGVCVDHLHRCKTSFGCSGFSTLCLQGVAADHLGPLPTKTPI